NPRSGGSCAVDPGSVVAEASESNNACNPDSVTVVAPPTISKTFGAATIAQGATTTPTFTLTNPAAEPVGLSGVGFTDTLPAGLTVPNGTTNDVCGSGSSLAIAGANTLTLSGGTLGVGSSCQFPVTVTGTTAGAKTNTTGNVSSTNGGTGANAIASLTVVAPPSITKAFGAASIIVGGTTTLTFTITNTNTTVGLTGVSVSDPLPGGLGVADGTLANACGSGGDVTTTAATGVISLTGGSIAANSTCSFQVTVTGTSTGVKDNTSGN